MRLGRYEISDFARAVRHREHYRALARMPRVYANPIEGMWRFASGRGDYPYECPIKTPAGVIRPTLHSPDDMLTVNEIFAREDYKLTGPARVVVDFGANIGLSALYFLTRNFLVRTYLYEPDPKNVARLADNLRDFAGRWTVEPAAIGLTTGEADFGVEPTGRYGGLNVRAYDPITVRVVNVNEALAAVLEREERIDVLKVDIEGQEVDVVSAIDPGLLDRIGVIFYESEAGAVPLHTDRFAHSATNTVNRLVATGYAT